MKIFAKKEIEYILLEVNKKLDTTSNVSSVKQITDGSVRAFFCGSKDDEEAEKAEEIVFEIVMGTEKLIWIFIPQFSISQEFIIRKIVSRIKNIHEN